ncbi:MAG: o-succinylbenzoate---CoA ligase [Actinomycetota bacterium]|nr:o-succinylbenzoate---CoA ligase [Actinomycetota bacterium]
MPDMPPRTTVLRAATRAALADAISRALERGEAVLPIDPSLSEADAERISAAGDEVVREDTALVLPTAGSTGEPKLVELSRAALEAAATTSLERLGAGPQDRWLCCLPLHHIAGVGILTRSLVSGTEPEIHEVFDPAQVARSEAAFVSVVPTMLVRLLDAEIDLSRFKAVLLGGARISPALLQRAAEKGANVVTTYGMTETCGGVVYDGVPLDGVLVELSAERTIRLGGPTLMSGYLGRPDATRAVLRDGWFETSDVGAVVDGRLEVIGRSDDVIITGGENVQPTEIESVLETHEDVVEALVVGREDDEWGERVVALLVTRGSVTPGELREFLDGRLAPHKVPKDLLFVHELPHLPSGKVRRPRPVLEVRPGDEG